MTCLCALGRNWEIASDGGSLTVMPHPCRGAGPALHELRDPGKQVIGLTSPSMFVSCSLRLAMSPLSSVRSSSTST
jgi:hypothetical protein